MEIQDNLSKAKEIANETLGDFATSFLGMIDEYSEMFCTEAALRAAKWKDEQLNEELNLITDWFNHIAQMADDKKTLSGAVMKDSDAFDEIKCLAKRCAEYVDKRLLNI